MTSRQSHLWPGVALASAVLFGASAPFAKLLLGTVSPQMLAGLLYLGAGVGLTLAQLGRTALGIPAGEAPLRCSDLPWLAAVVLAGELAGPLLLMLGLSRSCRVVGLSLTIGLATYLKADVLAKERRRAADRSAGPAHERLPARRPAIDL